MKYLIVKLYEYELHQLFYFLFFYYTIRDVIFLLFIKESAFAANSSLSILIGFFVIIFLTGKNENQIFFH